MSTNDVPGANPANNDVLRLGCWAEHTDGSLIFVYSTEGQRVIYSLFDPNKTPVMEYRDAMPIGDFERMFSTSAQDINKPVSDSAGRTTLKNLWRWHDKNLFPWDRIIKAGASDGQRIASAAETISAARRIADDLRLRGDAVKEDAIKHRIEDIDRMGWVGIRARIRKAVNALLE